MLSAHPSTFGLRALVRPHPGKKRKKQKKKKGKTEKQKKNNKTEKKKKKKKKQKKEREKKKRWWGGFEGEGGGGEEGSGFERRVRGAAGGERRECPLPFDFRFPPSSPSLPLTHSLPPPSSSPSCLEPHHERPWTNPQTNFNMELHWRQRRHPGQATDAKRRTCSRSETKNKKNTHVIKNLGCVRLVP